MLQRWEALPAKQVAEGFGTGHRAAVDGLDGVPGLMECTGQVCGQTAGTYEYDSHAL
jgi:hypothetical protein